jgi:hypothetical protein
MRSYLEPQIVPIELVCSVAGKITKGAKLTWSVDGVVEGDYPDPNLTIRLPDERSFSQSGPDLFECLLQLRMKHLDPVQIRVACNGSRRNAWASGMLRDVSRGVDVYVVTLGRDVTQRDIVRTFDPAPMEVTSTARQQIRFNRQWFKSLQSQHSVPEADWRDEVRRWFNSQP